MTLLLVACGNKPPPPAVTTGDSATGSDTMAGKATPPASGGACIATGCSATVCTEPGNDVMTTCEFKEEYACYQGAACERQADGKCGWTRSAELTACLAKSKAPTGPSPM
jgi:hypothetical protein